MKILYLLFSIFLLLIQGSAGNQFGCRQRGGYCTLGRCPRIHISLGRCSIFYACCKNVWG
uniref:Beta-defensin-like domain-containing protein n=1 Tax=Calidris pygmaea TaxID=425635 RepID=A0A8C3PR35_9CHAR